MPPKPAFRPPTDRLVEADKTLEHLNAMLERLWLQRHELYACIRDVKSLRRNLELARAGLEGSA
jgi:hypothetical protein